MLLRTQLDANATYGCSCRRHHCSSAQLLLGGHRLREVEARPEPTVHHRRRTISEPDRSELLADRRVHVMQRPAVEPARLGRTRFDRVSCRLVSADPDTPCPAAPILVRLVHLHRAPSASRRSSPPTSPHRIACFDDGLHHGRRPTAPNVSVHSRLKCPQCGACLSATGSLALDADPQRLRPQPLFRPTLRNTTRS